MQAEAESHNAQKCASFTSGSDDQDSWLQQSASEYRGVGRAQHRNSRVKSRGVDKARTISDLAVSEERMSSWQGQSP